ncbi:MAG: metalloregulator ArsR/SmtB family transcription factor [Bacillota bacterium]|nr:metalloregulator ArsR/SmtB family transcription factor [Bacillota bacterium]
MAKLKAICDESRIRILKLLAQRELCACDFIENLDLSQPTVSHHLKVLVDSNLIICEKRGKWCFYRINYSEFQELIREINILTGTRAENVKLCSKDCEGRRNNEC